ncbi:unnamed protein product [Enterobius vermicularis]|uniref:TIMELESS-interacting protein n=1 Tax=Enterobius vermicularis TaxID=51028 RepID=A0A0N4USK9_ENTVE|nr:unnamed protein product [Enterobius vermicularis]
MNEIDEYFGDDFFEENEVEQPSGEAATSDADVINRAFKKERIRKQTGQRPKLSEMELCGTKGIAALEPLFKDCKYNLKGNPYTNLSRMMSKIEHWAHLLYPSMNFDDFIARVETLGEKRMVQAYMNKMRFGDMTNGGDNSSELGNEERDDVQNNPPFESSLLDEDSKTAVGEASPMEENEVLSEGKSPFQNMMSTISDPDYIENEMGPLRQTLQNDGDGVDENSALDFIYTA